MTDWRDTLTHCKPRMLGVLVNGVVGGSRVGADINREIYNVTKLTSESSPVPIQNCGASRIPHVSSKNNKVPTPEQRLFEELV